MGLALSALLPLAGPLVNLLVQGAEKMFGPKTGETKKKVVVDALQPVVDAFVAAGKLPQDMDVNAIVELVEIVVQNAKKAGTLDGGPLPWHSINLPPGTKVTIEVPLNVDKRTV